MKVTSCVIFAVFIMGLITVALSSRVSNVPIIKSGFAEGAYPNDAEAAGIMWVGPSAVSLSGDSASIGYTFNVTVWLNMTQDLYAYQVGLLYNPKQLKCVRAGFTDGRTSDYFTGYLSAENIAIDATPLGNGSVMAFEACQNSYVIPGPHVGSLLWIEFEVVAVPASNEKFSSKFDVSTAYPHYTWVWDVNSSNIQIALRNSDYEISSGSGESVSVCPGAVTMLAGQSQVFSSNVSGGSPPYTFQWYANGYAAPDGTGPDWTFKPNTVGSYQVCLNAADSSETVTTSNVVWVVVTSPDVYNVTITAYCDTEGVDVSVPVAMDGVGTSFDTPHTFTDLMGTHMFTVSNSDLNGDPFRLWSVGDSASTTIVVSEGGTYTAYYGGDQLSANSMWVEPSIVDLTGDSATIGHRFNVTVWLNMSQDIFSYQIGLLYDRTLLKCTRAGFTDGGTSEYFTGHYTTAQMVIDTSLGNGSILAFEGCISHDCIQGPHVGSLIWAEFEVLAVPSANETLSSKFDISTEHPSSTWVCDVNLNFNIQFATYDGDYEIFSASDVSASVSPTAATMLVGQSQVFSSNVSGGTPPYTFQWYVNGYAAANGTGPDWTFKPNTPGSYHVYLEVTDSSNSSSASVVSDTVTVEVSGPQSGSSTSGSSTSRYFSGPAPILSSGPPKLISIETSEPPVFFLPTPSPDPPAVPGLLPFLLISCAIGAGLAMLLRRYWLLPRHS